MLALSNLIFSTDNCIQHTWTGSSVSLNAFMQAVTLLAQGMASGHTFSVNPEMFH